jgi:DNA-binding SARP family transcriptional activator
MGCDITIRLLGPIDVLTPAGPKSVGGAHARALVGALALAGGRSVSIDQLCRALWGDALPSSAESSLQTYVWRLRRLLGHDTLVAVDHSYQLNIRRKQIDALQFEDLLVEATDIRSDHQRCAELCHAGLSLWRGPPFGELGDDEPFQLEATRLDELRLTAIELLLEAEVALGHHGIAAAELECAVREHPYRERMWYLLIDALRLDGRRVEALRACRGLRRSLAEVGVEPTTDLAAIESQIVGEGPMDTAAQA